MLDSVQPYQFCSTAVASGTLPFLLLQAQSSDLCGNTRGEERKRQKQYSPGNRLWPRKQLTGERQARRNHCNQETGECKPNTDPVFAPHSMLVLRTISVVGGSDRPKKYKRETGKNCRRTRHIPGNLTN